MMGAHKQNDKGCWGKAKERLYMRNVYVETVKRTNPVKGSGISILALRNSLG